MRLVKKGRTPAPGQRKTSVTNIGPNRYTEDGHFFRWYPDPAKPEKQVMRLCVGGRFLYTNARDMRFIADVGLGALPADQWRDRLQAVLRNAHPALLGTTKWPWGDTLLTCDPADEDGSQVIEACERKATIDDIAVAFTTNCLTPAGWDEAALLTAQGRVIARLHDGAVSLGYRIVEMEARDGRYGPYQRITVSRGRIHPPGD